MNKKFFFVLCFLIIISFNVFSATTVEDTDLTSDNVQKVNQHHYSDDMVKESGENNVYVDVNSQSIESDGSIANPYKTINNEILGCVPSNSIVHVSDGNYTLTSINVDKNISFIGENKDKVIFTSQSSQSIFTIEVGSNVLFKNLTIKDYMSNSNAAITNNGNLVIENSYLYNNSGTTRANKGGSILNYGNLNISDSMFEKNFASWGSALYNFGNASVSNSTFTNNSIYNVGGALYNANGSITVHDSNFTSNRAVSGGAIYNMFGKLTVNNSQFYDNQVEWFGASIYSTGTASTSNCLFELNSAKKDGGAITNTHNFTVINCTFNENAAGENGGVFENLAWNITENGILTVFNSTFFANSASGKGGVVINYNKIEAEGGPANVTFRNSLFELNSASIGGVFYNEQYLDLEDCVFVENEAMEYMLIYSDDGWIKSINNNWWGKNSISEEDIGVMPEKWYVLKFTNTTALADNEIVKVQASLNTLNDGTVTVSNLPLRQAEFHADKSVFEEDTLPLTGVINNSVEYYGDILFVKVDNQQLSLKQIIPIDTQITINPIGDVRYTDNITMSGKLCDVYGNVLFNTALNAKINGKSVRIRTNSSGDFIFSTKAKITGQNNISISFAGNQYYNPYETNLTVNVIKLGVVLSVNDIDEISINDAAIIKGSLIDDNHNPLYSTCVYVIIGGNILKVKTNSSGEYQLNVKSLHLGENNVTVVFAGNDYYADYSEIIFFNVVKEDVFIRVNYIADVAYGDTINVIGNLTDSKNNALYNTQLSVSINNNVYKVKTDSKGMFKLSVVAKSVSNNSVYLDFAGNDYYNSRSIAMIFETVKQDVKFVVSPIRNISSKDNVSISGQFVDINNNALYNTNIQIKVNDNLFKVKTNVRGLFLLTTDNVVVGNNNVLISYNGNSCYNSNSTTLAFNVKK